VRRLGVALAWSAFDLDAIEQFRDELVDRVVSEARPAG